MLNRAFNLHDPRVIKQLQTDFVPVAFNINAHSLVGPDLPQFRTPTSSWYREITVSVGILPSDQAFLLVFPDGKTERIYYAVAKGPDVLVNVLEAAAVRARKMESVTLHSGDLHAVNMPDPVHDPWPAPTTSVLRVFSRIPRGNKEAEGDPAYMPAWDNLWMYAEEAREIVQQSAENREFAFPKTFVNRMLRHSLIDRLGGRTTSYSGADDIKQSEFTLRRVGQNGSVHSFVFQGRFVISRSAHSNEIPGSVGNEGILSGEFEIDQDTAKVIRFRAYASSQATGGGVLPHTLAPPKGRYPLVFAIVEADDLIARTIAPSESGVYNTYHDGTGW